MAVTKTEKVVIVAIVILVILMARSCYQVRRGLQTRSTVSESIAGKGLKGILTEVWEGTNSASRHFSD